MKIHIIILSLTTLALVSCANTPDTQIARYLPSTKAPKEKWCHDKKHQQFEEDAFYRQFNL